YIDEPLNAAHADYALANKPLALAHAEETASTEFVVFLDTDILAWREPSAFLFDGGIDIALIPDTTKTTASTGPGDPFEEYWMQLYDLVGATARPFVVRSEEHTSELQSLAYLVCRLLLEKKNKKNKIQL